MPIDPEQALAARLPPVPFGWGPDDVIRYHLALGAGSPVCAGAELTYVQEERLRVLPTFAAMAASAAAAVAAVAPGLFYDRNRIIQGGHEIDVFGELPTAGTSINSARIEAVHDTGRSAVVVIAVETELAGALAARNRFTLLLPGEGGFGGDAPPPRIAEGSERPADAVYRLATLPQQAALFRMSGDRNALHIDPEVAQAAGFTAPTLPGLCTWAMVAKTLVDREAGGDVAAMGGLSARFSGPVYPGETLELSVWRGAGERAANLAADVMAEYRFEASVVERAAPALSGGWFRLAGQGITTTARPTRSPLRSR